MQFEEQSIRVKLTCDKCNRALGHDQAELHCQCANSFVSQSEQPDKVEPSSTAVIDPVLAPELGERYDVLALIGSGAMASVYKIYDKSLGKIFAAKVVKSEIAAEPLALRRFADEAEAVSSMTHGNIAAVYSHGVTRQNIPFLCMDYLEGETLADILDRDGRLDPRQAVHIFQQVCDALIHAHMKGIIHRDLKPSNIFITATNERSQVVKLVDFGIAKLEYREEDSTRLTQTGALIGSPFYMSPEQCRGDKQDARSDIYSFGCVMYEALTGKPPFPGENAVKVILKQLKESPAPFNLPNDESGIAQALEACVLRCLEKAPEKRYQSADELLSQIQSLDYKGPNRVVTREARLAPWRRQFATMTDAMVLVFITHLLGLLLFAPTFASAEKFSHYPAWQLALLSLSCQFIAPIIAPTTIIFLISIFLFPAVFFSFILLPMTLPFFDSYGGAYLMTLVPFIYGIYCVLLESSPLQGTLGKRLFGLVVVNSEGGPLTMKQALIRHLTKWIAPIFFVSELAVTPVPSEFRLPISNFAAAIWKLIKFCPSDAAAGSYVIRKEESPVIVDRDRYITADDGLTLTRLKTMRKRWMRTLLPIPWSVLVTLVITSVVSPKIFYWPIPVLSLLFTWLPLAVVQLRIASANKRARRLASQPQQVQLTEIE